MWHVPSVSDTSFIIKKRDTKFNATTYTGQLKRVLPGNEIIYNMAMWQNITLNLCGIKTKIFSLVSDLT